MVPVLKKKRYIAVAVVTAVIFLVTLAPFILSSSIALRFVLSGLNSQIPGTLSVDSWLIGWQQGILCQQVVYHDPERGIRITVPRVTSTQGLLQVVLAPKNLGVLVVENPVIELAGVLAETGPGSGASPAGEQDVALGADTPLWNQVTVVLQIRDGLLRTIEDVREDAVGLSGLNVDAELQGGVINFDFDLHTLQRQGTVKGKGVLNLPARQYGWLDTFIADMDLSAIGLDVHDFLAFGAAHSSFPAGEGILNADIHIKAVGIEDFQVRGVADFSDLKLVGGMLGDDTPSFQKIHLAVDGARWSDKGWDVNQLDFVSDTASFQGSGQFSSSGNRLAGKGVVKLPVLFDQFPRLLKLREAAFIENGILDFDIDFMQDGREGNIKLKAGVEDFGGLFDGRKFAWTTPAAITLNIGVQDRDIQIHALRLDAPFLHVEGQGNLNSFTLDAAADFQQAFTEVGRLFQLGWDGAGTMEIAVRGTAPELDGDMLRVKTDMNIRDFTLNHRAAMVVPLHQFSLIGSVKVSRNLLWEGKGAFGMQVAFSSWLGEIFLVLNGEKSEGKPFQAYYTTDSTFNLDSITGLLHVFNKMSAPVSLAGDLQVQSAGFLDAGGVEIREFSGEVGGFVLVRGNDIFQDQKLRLEVHQSFNNEIPSFIIRDLVVTDSRESFFQTGAGLNLVRFDDHSVFLHNLRFSSVRTGNITLDTLHMPDWQNPLDRLDVALDSDVDIEQFSDLLRGVGLLPSGLEMAGRGSLTLSAGARDGDGRGDVSANLPLSGDFNGDTVLYKGIAGHGVSLSFSFKENTLHTEMFGTLNKGRLSFISDTDFTSRPPVIYVREGIQVMTSVGLQKPLVEELSFISPLFGLLADSTGTLDVRLDSLAWPLESGGGREASYVSVFDIKDVKLQSKGVLKGVLKQFGLEKEELIPHDTEMYCMGRLGRVICSPIRISVGGFEMVIGGSVGMDATLDYLLELPVTKHLVGSETYDVLEGEVIRIPVTGTMAQPLVDKKNISNAVNDLVRQVAARDTENQ